MKKRNNKNKKKSNVKRNIVVTLLIIIIGISVIFSVVQLVSPTDLFTTSTILETDSTTYTPQIACNGYYCAGTYDFDFSGGYILTDNTRYKISVADITDYTPVLTLNPNVYVMAGSTFTYDILKINGTSVYSDTITNTATNNALIIPVSLGNETYKNLELSPVSVTGTIDMLEYYFCEDGVVSDDLPISLNANTESERYITKCAYDKGNINTNAIFENPVIISALYDKPNVAGGGGGYSTLPVQNIIVYKVPFFEMKNDYINNLTNNHEVYLRTQGGVQKSSNRWYDFGGNYVVTSSVGTYDYFPVQGTITYMTDEQIEELFIEEEVIPTTNTGGSSSGGGSSYRPPVVEEEVVILELEEETLEPIKENVFIDSIDNIKSGKITFNMILVLIIIALVVGFFIYIKKNKSSNRKKRK